MKQVVIFGLTDFARIASVYLEHDSPYHVAAFTAHQAYIDKEDILGKPIVPFETLTETHPPDAYEMFVAIGFSRMNELRTKMYHECKQRGYSMISYINSKASHWGYVDVGDNTFIFEDNVLQPFVKIGNNTILWSGNHIGHDTTIGDNVFIASHVVISGQVSVGDNCFIGVNAAVAHNVKVAPYCLIGAGVTITRDTKPETVYKATKPEISSRKSTELNF
jgi:sugar O-acyltransferase (sialic acid O-acetyltransferase NeuD family)